jgi:hypothetical protein
MANRRLTSRLSLARRLGVHSEGLGDGSAAGRRERGLGKRRSFRVHPGPPGAPVLGGRRHGGERGRARTASPPRAFAAKFGEGCGAPGWARKLLWKYRFDTDRRSARSLFGSVRRVALLRPYRVYAPGERARPTKPGPGPRAYPPHACRSRPPRNAPPFLSSMGGSPGVALQVAARLGSEPPPTSASRSTAPRDREGRWPRALPIASRWVDYAAARRAEDK